MRGKPAAFPNTMARGGRISRREASLRPGLSGQHRGMSGIAARGAFDDRQRGEYKEEGNTPAKGKRERVGTDRNGNQKPSRDSRKGLKSGGPSGTRTPNQLIKSQLLYQLS